MKKPKILILFCGGTISMAKNKEGALVGHYTADQLFKIEPRVKELADLDVEVVTDVDSTNMDRGHWEKLVDLVVKNYSDYDGFLVTCGTNTMAYASSALSFALKDIGKPVVFTGAQIPAEVINTDAHNNFVNALRVAMMDIAGVFVVFGSKIILGCRAKKVNESELEAFDVFNDTPFGEIMIKIRINRKNYNHRHNKKLVAKNGFNDDIICLTLIPGLRSEHLIKLIDDKIKGVVLRAFGSGDVPYELFSALEYARKKKVPVLVTTQCPRGATVMGINEPGRRALELGVIQVFDMSMEAMSTKLMWAIKQGIPYEKMKKFIQTNFVGEIKE